MTGLTLVFVILDVALGLIFLILCMVVLLCGSEKIEVPKTAFVSFCISIVLIGSAVLLITTSLQLGNR